jgi:hypothetical protein
MILRNSKNMRNPNIVDYFCQQIKKTENILRFFTLRNFIYSKINPVLKLFSLY